MTAVTTTKKGPPDVGALLISQKAEIMRALPRHMSPDRMLRIALTEIRKNPKLKQCDPYSFLGAIIQCAQLGLEPGSGLGHAYLIPFNNKKLGIIECTFMPGFRGLIDLARRSGKVQTISARIVHEKDEFIYEYGDNERISHKPFEGADDEAGRITHVYSIARLTDGGIQREVMTRLQIDRIRDRGNPNPVWETDFDEMARKTVVRRITKYLPQSPELAVAIERDNSHYKGESQENWSVLDASYTPKAIEPEPQKANELRNGTSSADQYQPEPLAAADKKMVIQAFEKAVMASRGRNISVEKVVGATINDVLLSAPDRIQVATDLLELAVDDSIVEAAKK